MTKEKPRQFSIWGEGTREELEAKRRKLENGEELLPDGTRYQERDRVRIFWELVDGDPFDPGYFKGSKQLLDITYRIVEKKDLRLPIYDGQDRRKIEVAIAGGLASVDLTFKEKRVLHAVEAAFSDASRDGHYPDQIDLTRARLYDYLGVGWKTRPDGTRYRAEGLGYERRSIEKTLFSIRDKPFAFTFRAPIGKFDKKTGEELKITAWTQEPIFKVGKIYGETTDRDLPGIQAQRPEAEKRFTCYRIRLNPHAIGEVEHYFRYMPRLLAKRISDYRATTGGRASAAELNFIEYLFMMSQEIIEINFLKLAEKLKIKMADNPRKIRAVVSRCYETARALGYVLAVEEDRPALKGTKDIIRVNPAKFKYLRRALPGRQEGGPG